MAKSPINYDKPYEISVSTNSETGERTTTFRQGSNYLSVEDKDPSIAPATPPGEEFSLGPSPLRQRLDERAAAASTGQPLEYQKAAPAVSPNEETPPEITVETAQAAVETAQYAAFLAEFDQTIGQRQASDKAEAEPRGAENITSATTTGFSSKRDRGQSFDINRFRAEVVNSDSVLPTHSFLVVFSRMDWVTKQAASAGRQELESMLTMRCENAVLPSINLLQEQNIRRYGFGPVENVPYGVNVGDFTLQFIVDKQALIVDFFEAWLNKIVNRDSYGGANMNPIAKGAKPYEVAYKDSYACSSVNVFVYDRAQNNILEYNIYDVFPTGIQSMNMSWSEENTLMKLNVTFSFTDLRIRPTFSAFGQDAASAPPRPVNPVVRKFLERGDQPLVSEDELRASMAASLTDVSKLPVIIGDGNNGVPRTVSGRPSDTPAQPAGAPEVPAPTTRNPFGTPEIIA